MRSTSQTSKQRRQDLFLKHFARWGHMRRAAAFCGLTVRNVSSWVKNDPKFAERYQEAKDEAMDEMESECYRRAVRGTKKLVLYQGEPVKVMDPKTGQMKYLYEKQFSDGLMMFLLKAGRPEKYREKATVDLRGALPVKQFENVDTDKV